MKRYPVAVWKIMLLISLATVAAVLPTPALPDISQYFATGQHVTQYVVVLFLLGYVFGQLIYGPISNRFGYARALFFGLVLNILGVLICILSYYNHGFILLLTGRFLSALGSSAGLICSFVLINSLFSEESMRRIIAYAVLAFNLGSGLAVTLGGILTTHFGWLSCFIFLLFYGLCALACLYQLPNSPEPVDKSALQLKNIVVGYFYSFSSLQLLCLSCIMSVATTVAYLYASSGIFIAHHVLMLSPEQYGFWSLLNSMGTLSGAVLTARWINKMTNKQFIFFGTLLALLFSTVLFIIVYFNLLTTALFFILMAFVYFSVAFIYPNASALAMQAVTNKANASATMNFINMGFAWLMVSLMGMIPSEVSLQFSSMVVFSVFIGLVLAVFCLD